MAPKDRESAKSTKSPQELQEELAFLRQKATSMTFRGQYEESVKFVEEHLSFFYSAERWPEQFLNILLLHRKCYPALNRKESYEEYAAKLLEKSRVPAAFLELMRGGGKGVSWTAEFFREKTLELRKGKEYERSLGYAEIHRKLEPYNSNAYLLIGWLYEDLGRMDEAVSMYEQALEMSASNLQARQGIVRVYTAANPKKAFEYVQKALEAHPDDAALYAAKALLLTKAGDREGAMEAWDKASTLEPYEPSYLHEKGELLLAENRETAAIAQYRRAIALSGRYLPSLTRLAFLLAEQASDIALEYTRIVSAAEPDDLEIGLLYAKLLRQRGDRIAAERQYRRLLEQNENDHRIWAGLARGYSRAEPERALEHFDRAAALDPRIVEYQMGKAAALETLGRLEEAEVCYRAAAELDRRDAVPLGALGRILTETKPQEALGFFDRAIRLAPKTGDYYSGKAAILQNMEGKTREALEALRLACTYDPGNAQLHRRSGLLLEGMGNRASSIRYYEEASSLDPRLDDCFAGIARQLATTQPHSALHAINSALTDNLLNPQYYYWKALILSRLAGDDYALSQLALPGPSAKDKERADEIEALRAGGAMRMALHYANRAVELAPKDNGFLCFRANLLMQMGQDSQAQAQYEALLKQDPDSHEALYGEGLLLAKRRQHKKAEERFERAIRLSPHTARYHAAKAKLIAKEQERYAEAVACYNTAIPLDTWAWEPVLELARLLDENGDTFVAMANYRRCLLIYRDCLPATARMGQLLYEYKPLSALTYIRHAIHLEESSWLHHAWHGSILHKLGRSGEAADALARAAALATDGAETYYRFAGIMSDALPEQALDCCRKAIELEPGRSDYHTLLGDLLRKTGDSDGMLAAYQEACRINARNHLAQARLARRFFELGDERALAAAEEAVKAAPKEASYLLLKAELLAGLADDLPGALLAAEAAVKLAPGEVEPRELLVELLQKKRALLRLPIEKIKLERVRKRCQAALEAEADVEELTFDEEQEAEAPGHGETDENAPEAEHPPADAK